ncbi:MAG: hypothetical protein NT023_25740 [Armatimonadetes bacterium]|nr:hypothetical protein [Armatimonadota bacterium]
MKRFASWFAMTLFVLCCLPNIADATFSTPYTFYASLTKPYAGMTYHQGSDLIPFRSEHAGALHHFNGATTESGAIRSVLAFIDPPGHAMNPYHIVQQYTVGRTFAPGEDAWLKVGDFSASGSPTQTLALSGEEAMDWVGTYTALAKTNYSTGAADIVGAYSSTTYQTIP